jgi:hypothetical protein
MAVRDISQLFADRQITIYQNGLKQIFPEQGQVPAGKMGHAVLWDNIIESSINRITDYRLLNLRGYFNTLRTYGDGEAAIGSDFIIYMNVSGGNLLGVNPTVSGNSGTSGEDWRPITSGPPPGFNIPLWNGDGLTTDGAGNPITNGTGVYADQQLVRADNDIYQRVNATLPAPVSANFLDEYRSGFWQYMGDIITLFDLAEFQSRLANSQLTPSRYYLITDADSANGDKSIILQATANNNYSPDGFLIADYTGLGRGTVDFEKITYDAINDKLLERWDNYGNYASQFSTNVNQSTQAANSVTRAPWGNINFNSNILRDCYIVNLYDQAEIATFNGNNLTDTILDHTHNVGTDFNFNNNYGDSGTYDLTNTINCNYNRSYNGGKILSVATDVIHATSGDESATSSASNAKSLGKASIASAISSLALGEGSNASGNYSKALGYLSTAGMSGSTALGSGSTVIGIDGVALGFGTTVSANSGTAVGRQCTVSGAYGSSFGVNSVASKVLQDVHGNTAIGLIDNSYVRSYVAGFSTILATMGLTTTSTSKVKLLTTPTVLTSDGKLNLYANSVIQFNLNLQCFDSGTNKIAMWDVKGKFKTSSGSLTQLGNLLYLQDAGTYSTSHAYLYADAAFTPVLEVNFATASELIINVTPASTASTTWVASIQLTQLA